MGFKWDVTPEQAFIPMAEAEARRIHHGVRAIADKYAPEITAYMKANALWQDQTGAARAGLYTAINEVAMQMVQLILSHGDDIDYGIWLEVRWSGSLSIIAPSVSYWQAIIWQDVQRLVRA